MGRGRLPLIGGAIVTALLIAAAVWLTVNSTDSIGDASRYVVRSPVPGEPVMALVREGQGAKDIGRELEDKGIIESAKQFEVLVSLMGYNGALQAGDYEFQTGSPVLSVIYRMRRGELSSRTVTVVEGWRTEEVADALEPLGVPREAFLAAARSHDYDFDFVSELPQEQSLEGFLYPATYPVRIGEQPSDLVRQMLQAFSDNVPEGVRDSAAESGMSLSEVLTLASIIEREARIPDERPIMAQVFLSRLADGMPLQADPTVQYALASERGPSGDGWWKKGLTVADLGIDSPYNTYLYPGLPPGPISNPSLASIISVIQPADTNYFYFVAKPDGSHAFATTLKEHEANVEKYLGAE